MNIDKYTEVIKACRFCFMCRHLSGIGNVTFSEADTPRVRASMIDGITRDPDMLANADFIATIYKSDLSRACTYHCVKHYDENSLNLAVRRDIVESGLVPSKIAKIAKDFAKLPPFKTSGKAPVLYYIDKYTADSPAIVKAFDAVMKKSKVKYMTAQGGCVGKVFRVLGFIPEAKKAAKSFADFVKKSGAKTIVVSNPAAYDALVNDFKEYGVKLSAKVMHTSEYIASLKLKFKKAGTLYYLESDFLKNYNDNYKFPRELLKQMKADIVQFGTNNEESYTAGEGALILPLLSAELVEKMAEYIGERADDPKKDILVTASPYTRKMLSKYTKLNVVSIEELAAKNI